MDKIAAIYFLCGGLGIYISVFLFHCGPKSIFGLLAGSAFVYFARKKF